MIARVGDEFALLKPWGGLDVGARLVVHEVRQGGMFFLSHNGKHLAKGWTRADRDTVGLVARIADPVNHPPHYTQHPSGVECIQVTEHMGFCLGNAVKYIWRADLKGNAVEDLKKARFYIDREIERREKISD